MSRNQVRTALVTGSSSGIGRACASVLIERGYRVFGGVRREEDARALALGVGNGVTPVMLDVTDDESVSRAVALISASVGEAGLHALVNNAGVVVAGPLEYLRAEEISRQFEVNVLGTLRVTRACLPLLRFARGRIVIVGSIAGRVSFPFLGPYSASKAALASLAATLRMELRAAGVLTCVVEPGSVATPIWEKSFSSARDTMAGFPPEALEAYGAQMEATLSSSAVAASMGVPPVAVARALARALAAPRMRGRYLVGWDARLLELAQALLPPSLYERFQIALVHRGRRASGVAESRGNAL